MPLAIQLQPIAWSVRKPHDYKGKRTAGWMPALKPISCSPRPAPHIASLHNPSLDSLGPSTLPQPIACIEFQPVPSSWVWESVGLHPCKLSTLALSLPPCLTLIKSLSIAMLWEAILGKSYSWSNLVPRTSPQHQSPIDKTPGEDLKTHAYGDKALSFTKRNHGTPICQGGDYGLCLRTLMSSLFCWLLSWVFSMNSYLHIRFEGCHPRIWHWPCSEIILVSCPDFYDILTIWPPRVQFCLYCTTAAPGTTTSFRHGWNSI